MSTRTRRLVFLSVLVMALALPAETLLLRALVTPQPQQAVENWVAGMDAAELSQASGQIQSYPVMYRRAIMERLTPAHRASVWRGHVSAYLQAHPELDATAVDLIKTAYAVITPEIFADPTEARRAAVRVVAQQLIASIGRDETVYLLAQLGPRDGTFASAEPLSLYYGNKIRGLFMASAADDCNCYDDNSCYDGMRECESEPECEWDNFWPMCGWLWSDPCEGLCSL